MHPSCLPPDQLLRDCEWTFTRRSGPGGQHRNKVESAAVVTHVPTGTVAEASERRSQADNRRAALWRLRMQLALAHRAAPLAEPSACWTAHRQGPRIVISGEHDNLPALVAETLDHLAAHDWQLAATAEWLCSTSTQVVRLLSREPAALVLVNRQRAKHDLPPLRA